MEKRLSMPDGLRVLAIGLVMAFHIWQQSWLSPVIHLGGLRLDLSPLVRTGYLGVDAMLLLSGYLLALPQARGKQLRPIAFYRKRLIRIMPCYLLCVGMYFFASALPRGEYASAGAMWKDLLTHLTFTHAFFYDTYVATHLNVVLWTLAIEMQFYLIYPLVIRCFQKNCLLTYAAMVLSALLFRRYAASGERTVMFMNQLPAMLDLYANGMLAACVYKRLSEAPQRTAGAWLSTALAVASAALIYLILGRQLGRQGGENVRLGQMLWRFPLSALGGVCLVCASRSIRLLRALLSNRPVRFLSGLSFNFYIWHQFLAVQLKKWHIPPYTGDAPNREGQQPWQNQYTFCCFAGALVLSLLVTYLVEKPCAKAIKRRFCRKSTASETAGDDAVARVL